MQSSNLVIKYFVLILSFLIVMLLISFSNNIIFHIVYFSFFCIICMALVRFDFLHPYVWFGGFFCLYSIGYPILYIFGVESVEYTKEIFILQLIALFTFFVILSPRRILRDVNYCISNANTGFGFLNKIIYCCIILLLFISSFYIKANGYSGKEEIYSNGGFIINIVFKLPLVLMIYFIFSFSSYYKKNKKINKKEIVIVGLSLLILTLFSGERDFIFRFLIIIIFLLYYFGIISLKRIIFITPLLLLIIPLSAIFKYYFLGQGLSELGNTNSLIQYVFYGEFESASRNLQIIINDKTTNGILGFKQLALDFFSVFIKSIKSTNYWFNMRYFPNSNVQYGFSMVAEGYLIAGKIGIVLLFIIVRLIVKLFYNNMNKNNYWLASYLYLITLSIYSIRAEFGIILSGLIKQIVLILIFVYIGESISSKEEVLY